MTAGQLFLPAFLPTRDGKVLLHLPCFLKTKTMSSLFLHLRHQQHHYYFV